MKTTNNTNELGLTANETLSTLLDKCSLSEILDIIANEYTNVYNEKTSANFAKKYAKNFRDEFLNK